MICPALGSPGLGVGLVDRRAVLAGLEPGVEIRDRVEHPSADRARPGVAGPLALPRPPTETRLGHTQIAGGFSTA